eukprot:1160387-Pelagomonas_calceolata.AAC.5
MLEVQEGLSMHKMTSLWRFGVDPHHFPLTLHYRAHDHRACHIWFALMYNSMRNLGSRFFVKHVNKGRTTLAHASWWRQRLNIH